jgi:hypothetical protein
VEYELVVYEERELPMPGHGERQEEYVIVDEFTFQWLHQAERKQKEIEGKNNCYNGIITRIFKKYNDDYYEVDEELPIIKIEREYFSKKEIEEYEKETERPNENRSTIKNPKKRVECIIVPRGADSDDGAFENPYAPEEYATYPRAVGAEAYD